MRVEIIMSVKSTHTGRWTKALLMGFRSIGVEAVESTKDNVSSDSIVCCWGLRAALPYIERGQNVLIIENGYLSERTSVYASLAWNGLNGKGEHCRLIDDGSRFKEMGGEIKPWKQGGEYALILGQVPQDASVMGVPIFGWYEKMAREIKGAYGMPVKFRPHPQCKTNNMRQSVVGAELMLHGTLEEAMQGAAFTVCWNSNSSVDSVLAGVPCVIGDKGSMAVDMCSFDVRDIRRPYRIRWAHELAFKQWTEHEIAQGEILGKMMEVMP